MIPGSPPPGHPLARAPAPVSDPLPPIPPSRSSGTTTRVEPTGVDAVGPEAAGGSAGVATAWPQLLFSALFGIFMGFAALGFILPIHWAEDRAEGWARDYPHLLLWATLIVPALGGLLCAFIQRLLPLDLRGHGVSMVLFAVARLQSRLPFRLAVRQWLTASATILTGGSAGPEGPIVTIGGALGSTAGRLAKQDRSMTTTLVGAGAAAGIAAVFNAPIAGVFFALEVLLRDFSLRTLAPIVVASVLASATTQTLIGSRQPLFGVNPAVLDSMREILTIAASPAFVVLGIACAIVGVLFVRALGATERFAARLRMPRILKPALGGLCLGILGAGAVAVSMRSGDASLPVFMGNGYGLVDRLVNPAAFESTARGEFALVLLLWLMLKMLATCLTLGFGGSGGLFAPGLLLGALTGGIVGIGVDATGLLPQATPAHFALVGMAGAVAAMMHAPLSGILLVYELTQDYSLILPLMLTATIATLVARSLERESVYTAELAAQGIRLGRRGDASLLKRLTVRDVTLAPAVALHPSDTGDRLVGLSERLNAEEFVVTDESERYVGMIGGAELRAALVYREALPLMQVSEIMRTDAPTITLGETLDVALARLTADRSSRAGRGAAHAAEPGIGAIAVLDPRGRVEGLLTRERLLRRYHEELERDG